LPAQIPERPGRSKTGQAGPNVEPSCCSMRPRNSTESRSMAKSAVP